MSRTGRIVVSLGAGVLFAFGLGVARLTLPATIRDGLDITGRWNPSMFVTMAAAVAVYFAFTRVAAAMRGPLGDARFALPRGGRPTAPALAGSALFGTAWGLVGLCPGPAIASSLVNPSVLLFVLAMAAGILLHDRSARAAASARSEPDAAARSI